MMRDPLEQELEALELPRIPAEIRSRIGRAVEEDRSAPRSGIARRDSLYRVAAVGMGVAASLAIAILVIHGNRSHSIHLPQVVLPVNSKVRDDHPEMRMTLAMYTSAEHQSGKALDSMLDADAARSISLARGSALRAACHSLDDLDH